MMPRKDGLEVCHTLKNDTRTSHIPILLLTAKVDQTARLQGLQQGADVYLAKPFDPKELLVRLQALLQQRSRLQAHYLTLYGLANNSTIKKIPTPEEESVFVKKVRSIIEANLDNTQFSVEQLSQDLALSTTQLYRKLKAQTGKSAHDLIRSIRLSHAQHLLKEANESIAEVAYSTGFSDPDYFSKVFKKEVGMRPSEFRKRHAESGLLS